MNTKLIVGIVITCSVIAGLLIGFNDNSYLEKTNSNELNIESSGDSITSGDSESGDFSNDLQSNIELNSGEAFDEPNEEIITNQENDITSNVSSKNNLPETVKAVYATGWVMGTPAIRESMITLIKENGYNAIVIDIKDEAGQLSYNSTFKTAIDISASIKMISNVESVIN